MRWVPSLIAVWLSVQATAAERQYYVTVPLQGREMLQTLVDKGLDVGGVNFEKRTASLVVKESELTAVVPLRVLRQRIIPAPDALYKKPTDVDRILKQVETNYPQLAKVETIGKSTDGRDILAINIQNRFVVSDQPKKAVIFDAMHHAREVMTPEVALDIVEYLTKYYPTDPKVKKWVDTYSIWVVPMVNPDGNNKVWTSSSMWRKNTRGGYGVDVNRNYPYAWNTCNGSSGSTSSDTYRGPSAGSEPETKAVTGLASRVRPMFNVSYHSYSEIVIYPYGCSPLHIPAPDQAVYEKVGHELAGKLVRDSGSGTYEPGTAYELLYNVDGGSIDWMYAEEKIMSFVIEVNSDMQGFQPSYAAWRDKTVQKQRAGWQYILDRMEGPGLPSRH